MKRIILSLFFSVIFGVSNFSMANAHEYNPFKDEYKTISQREEEPGKVQFVYVLLDEEGLPLKGAVLGYFDHDGKENTIKADEEGKVRLVYTSGIPFVQLKEVNIDGKAFVVIGEDITANADRKDVREGDVDYYVLQKDAKNEIMYVFEAD